MKRVPSSSGFRRPPPTTLSGSSSSNTLTAMDPGPSPASAGSAAAGTPPANLNSSTEDGECPVRKFRKVGRLSRVWYQIMLVLCIKSLFGIERVIGSAAYVIIILGIVSAFARMLQLAIVWVTES